MASANSDKDFLEFIIKALVDNPDKVEVNRVVDEMGVLLNVKIDPKDMGRIIGRAGATIRAIRSLTKLVGLKNNARVNVKIEEPAGGSRVSGGSSESSDVMDDLNNI